MTAATREVVYAALERVAERWCDTGAALRRALPELGRGELALLCLYVGAGFAVRHRTRRETFVAVAGFAFEHVEGAMKEFGLVEPGRDEEGGGE